MEQKTKWTIDPAHSEIGFSVKHMMITNVRGKFLEYNASIYTIGDDFTTAEFDFWLNPASLETNNDQRNTHLRSADFFDVENHKEITFRSNTIEKTGDNEFELWGNLTIKGITKKIKLQVEYSGTHKDPGGNTKAGFSIAGNVNRKDWELNWNTSLEAGGVLVGDTVKINCEVQLLKETSA